MQIQEVQHDFNLQYRAKPRTPGLHVSEIISDIAIAMGMFKGDDKDELDWTLAKYRALFGEDIRLDFPTAIYRVAFGLAWEQWYGAQNPDMNFHAIGELAKDGVIGTPDGLEFRDIPRTNVVQMWAPKGAQQYGIIHECKVTWKSSRDHSEDPVVRIAKEWAWLAQIKAYCWLAHTPDCPVLTGLLHVYWVNGNYRGSGPQFRNYELTFSEQELKTNWNLLVKTGALIQSRRAAEA